MRNKDASLFHLVEIIRAALKATSHHFVVDNAVNHWCPILFPVPVAPGCRGAHYRDPPVKITPSVCNRRRDLPGVLLVPDMFHWIIYKRSPVEIQHHFAGALKVFEQPSCCQSLNRLSIGPNSEVVHSVRSWCECCVQSPISLPDKVIKCQDDRTNSQFLTQNGRWTDRSCLNSRNSNCLFRMEHFQSRRYVTVVIEVSSALKSVFWYLTVLYSYHQSKL